MNHWKHAELGWAWPICSQQLDELMEMPRPLRCQQLAGNGETLCFYHDRLARGLTCSHLGTVRKTNNHARKDLMALMLVAMG